MSSNMCMVDGNIDGGGEHLHCEWCWHLGPIELDFPLHKLSLEPILLVRWECRMKPTKEKLPGNTLHVWTDLYRHIDQYWKCQYFTRGVEMKMSFTKIVNKHVALIKSFHFNCATSLNKEPFTFSSHSMRWYFIFESRDRPSVDTLNP